MHAEGGHWPFRQRGALHVRLAGMGWIDHVWFVTNGSGVDEAAMRARLGRKSMGGSPSQPMEERGGKGFVHVELDGKTYLLQVNEQDTFYNLKRKMQEKTGVEPSSIQAFCDDKKKMDLMLISSAGVNSGDRIVMKRIATTTKKESRSQPSGRRTSVEREESEEGVAPQEEESASSEEETPLADGADKNLEDSDAEEELEPEGSEEEGSMEEAEPAPVRLVDKALEAEALTKVEKIHADVDEYESQVREAVTEFDFGSSVNPNKLLLLEEMLMKKILLLDGVEVSGIAREKRREEIVRIQGLCKLIDDLKDRLAWQ